MQRKETREEPSGPVADHASTVGVRSIPGAPMPFICLTFVLVHIQEAFFFERGKGN